MFESIAVVGATGAVGTIIRELLEARKFPFQRVKFLASARSAGKEIPFAARTYTIEELKPEAFEGMLFSFRTSCRLLGMEMVEPLLAHGVHGMAEAEKSHWFRLAGELGRSL